jgi:hypothetical protein
MKTLAILAHIFALLSAESTVARCSTNWEEKWGFLYQSDHLNASTGGTFTRIMQCNEMLKDDQVDENCTSLVFAVIIIILLSNFQLLTTAALRPKEQGVIY